MFSRVYTDLKECIYCMRYQYIEPMARLDNGVVSICNKSHNEMLSHYEHSRYETMYQNETNPITRKCRNLRILVLRIRNLRLSHFATMSQHENVAKCNTQDIARGTYPRSRYPVLTLNATLPTLQRL